LKKILKNQPNKKFDATVTKIKPFGIYFDLKDYFVDGFLHISDLKDDYYEYDEKALKLIGSHTSKSFSFGSKIIVKIINIDLIMLEVEYRFIRR